MSLSSVVVFLHDDPARLWAIGGFFTGRQIINAGAGEVDHGQYDGLRPDFYYVCVALARSQTLGCTGGFDERFFMYAEDLDTRGNGPCPIYIEV